MSDGIEIATGVLNEFTEIKVKELLEKRPWMEGKKFVLLTKTLDIEKYIDTCIEKGLCALDLETTGLNTRKDSNGESSSKIVGVCLANSGDEGIYIPVAHQDKEFNVPIKFGIREIARLVKSCRCIFHNFKYDAEILRNYGIIMEDEDLYEDTLLMAAIEDASRKEKNLKFLVESLLGREMIEIDELGIQGSKKNIVAFDMVPPQKAVYYGGGDAMCTFALYEHFKAKIDEQDPTGKAGPWAIYRIEKRCLFVTMEMERNMARIDRAYVEKCKADVIGRIQKMMEGIRTAAGRDIDINSPKQLGILLFDEMKIPYPVKEKTSTNQYITNEKVLEKLAGKYPIVDMILTYRGYVKILETYIENFLRNADENDEVKFQLNQVRADTGRFSSTGGQGLYIDGYSGVNCQNIPNFDPGNPNSVDLRKAIIARPGKKIVSIDYSGEELRIAANFSREPLWLKEFINGTGDLHSITARIIHNKNEVTKKERGVGKCVAKGTRIASERGWIPIERLKAGDRVISHTGELKEIEAVHQMGIKPSIYVETDAGHRIVCGLNHRYKSTSGEWIRAEDLKEGDEVTTASCEKQNPKNVYRMHLNFWSKGEDEDQHSGLPYIDITPTWGRLFGYILGDEHMHPNYVGMVCSEIYDDVKKYAVRISEALGLPTSCKLRKRVGAKHALWTINFGPTVLARFFRILDFRGRRGKIFRIPDWIFESPKEISREFLSGLFETNGTVDKELVSVCTKDRDLAGDIQLLLASFGIRAYIRTKPSKKYKRNYYNVEFGRLGADIFEKEIGFISKRKKERLAILTGKKRHPGSSPRQNWFTKIKKTELRGDTELWDLTVKEDHTYVAEGLVTHNTLNFLTLYGGGAGGFATKAKVPYETAKKMMVNFFREYKGLKKWIDDESARSRKRGYSLTAFGRRRSLAFFYASQDKKDQAAADRLAINSAIQGTGADILKIALYLIWKWIRNSGLEDDIKILIPVHDEIVFEVKEDKLDALIPELCNIMRLENVTKKLNWAVPLEVDAEYGDSLHVDHDFWKEYKKKQAEAKRQDETKKESEVAPVVEAPAIGASQESLQETSEKPKTEECVDAPKEENVSQDPVRITGGAENEIMAERTKQNDQDVAATVVVDRNSGNTINDVTQYLVNITVNSDFKVSASKKEAEEVLKKINESKDLSKSIQDTHINDRLDSNGYFNYPIEINYLSACKLRCIFEILAASKDHVFIGPKHKVCILNKDGEVYYRTSEPVSIDAFIALCLDSNI